MRHSFYDGKYTVEFNEETAELRTFRNGEPWLENFKGDRMVLAMLQDYDERVRQLEEAHAEIARLQRMLEYPL